MQDAVNGSSSIRSRISTTRRLRARTSGLTERLATTHGDMAGEPRGEHGRQRGGGSMLASGRRASTSPTSRAPKYRAVRAESRSALATGNTPRERVSKRSGGSGGERVLARGGDERLLTAT